MTTLLEEPNVAEEAEARKADAQNHFNILKRSNALAVTNSLRVGFHGYYLLKNNLIGMLGFQKESEVWEAAGVCASTWYAKTRLAELFDGVDEESFCAMKGSNAEELSDLPMSKRLDPYWLKKAATESMKTFKATVEAEIDGAARRSDGKEPTSTLKMPMPSSRKKTIEEGLQRYAAKVGVDGDESRALEILVAEKTGETTLVQAITNAVQHIKNAKAEVKSGKSADEVLATVMDEIDAMALEFQAALQNLENHEDRPH